MAATRCGGRWARGPGRSVIRSGNRAVLVWRGTSAGYGEGTGPGVGASGVAGPAAGVVPGGVGALSTPIRVSLARAAVTLRSHGPERSWPGVPGPGGYDMIRRRRRGFSRPVAIAASTAAPAASSPRCLSSSPSRTRSGSHAPAGTESPAATASPRTPVPRPGAANPATRAGRGAIMYP
jgi:hypothetical protein